MSAKQDRRLDRLMEAERAVLGGVLVDNAQMDVAQELVSEYDFYRASHRTIFEALLRLANRGAAMDLITLRAELTPEQLEEIGLPYYAGLIDGVPRATNVRHYARVVREAALRRGIAVEARRLITAAEDEEEPAEAVLEQGEQALFGLRDRATTIEVVTPARRASNAYRLVESAANGQGMRGVPTGLADLDQRTRGLHPGNLLVVAARPSMGKSALAQNVCIQAAKATGDPALLFSLEMTEDELDLRELAIRAQLESRRIAEGLLHGSDYGLLTHAMDAMHAGGVHVVDRSSLTVGQVRAITRRQQAQLRASGKSLSVVVIDYLQLLTPDRHKGRRADTRTLELGEMTRSLKILAGELRVPIMLLSQLSRAPEQRADKRPILADLRESGAIEQDANDVWLLYRPAAYPEFRGKHPDHYVECHVAKQRNGPTGMVPLAFFRDQTRFADWTDRHEGGPR